MGYLAVQLSDTEYADMFHREFLQPIKEHDLLKACSSGWRPTWGWEMSYGQNNACLGREICCLRRDASFQNSLSYCSFSLPYLFTYQHSPFLCIFPLFLSVFFSCCPSFVRFLFLELPFFLISHFLCLQFFLSLPFLRAPVFLLIQLFFLSFIFVALV
jgi:hypothetical protein